MTRFALLLLAFGLLGDKGAEHGRTGNAFYEQKQYGEAVMAYRDGLAALDDTTGVVYASLQNNLGAALHRQERFADARAAFQEATEEAETQDARVRALYNAATAAAGMGNLSAALRDYKDVLLLDPTHLQARYNYEYLKRQLAKRQPRSRPPRDIEPSAYARRVKKKAEIMVAEEKYASAAKVMREGLRKDSTVAAYQEFMGRLDEIVQITQSP